MKYYILTLVLATLALQGCKKDDPAIDDKNVLYTEKNIAFSYKKGIPQLDVDNDGKSDMLFNVYLYMSDGWAVEQYYISVKDGTEVAIQQENNVFAFSNGVLINADTGNGTVWKDKKNVLFEARARDMEKTKLGNFKDLTTRYAAIRLKKNDQYYYGWIKITHRVNAAGKDEMLIAQTAVNKTAGQSITTK